MGEARKAREEGSDWIDVVGGERREESFITSAAFWLCVDRSAWFSFRVSWSLRRRSRMDSGVGAEGERGS